MEQRTYLVHQKPHSSRKKSVIVMENGSKKIEERQTKPNKHTRRTFAGKYNPETKSLVIGIAGNHLHDPYVKSIGKEIALERIEKESSYLQSQKKQVVIKNLKPEEVKDTFFEQIKLLTI